MLEWLATIGFFKLLTPAQWLDVTCLLLLIVQLVLGYCRGLVSMLTWAMALILLLQSGYWLYPLIACYARHSPLSRLNPTLGALLVYLLASIIGLLLFFILRHFLRRFFRLLVEQPVDRIFGLLAGGAIGLLMLFFVVSLAYVMPPKSSFHRLVCLESYTGRSITPALEAVLEARPASLSGRCAEERQGQKKRKAGK